MRQIIIFILFIAPFISINAQETDKVDPPMIVTKLKSGKTLNLDKKSIKFMGVTEDSRCPTGVSCVWEGQAKAVIGFYENDKLIEQKVYVFGSSSINPNNMEELLDQDKTKVYGYTLSPYPSFGQKIEATDYFLELVVK
ncbi:hypothetical protein [Aquimarina sp. 2201CG5-10]|uniref:hypothetical protein n=1 Tax=Aquimarina callyspongiae TaxID=3098150 RepID=UPI002AB33FD5|nr:hypothetical protein [Aquimarina sp. 2201CG5-10]MDY8137043.1 hypothetical protein [Aquimarina sp. 2201CG5-10]